MPLTQGTGPRYSSSPMVISSPMSIMSKPCLPPNPTPARKGLPVAALMPTPPLNEKNGTPLEALGAPSEFQLGALHPGLGMPSPSSWQAQTTPAGNQSTIEAAVRKKPGRKPGTKSKATKDADTPEHESVPAPKVRKPRKPRDPDAPPIQRKRKLTQPVETDVGSDSKSLAAAALKFPGSSTPASLVPILAGTSAHFTTHLRDSVSLPPSTASHSRRSSGEQRADPYAQKSPKREVPPGFTQGVPTTDTSGTGAPSTMRSSGQKYDPVRGNYDPIRESFAQPRPPSSPANRASASAAIASLVDPPVSSTRSLGFTRSTSSALVPTAVPDQFVAVLGSSNQPQPRPFNQDTPPSIPSSPSRSNQATPPSTPSNRPQLAPIAVPVFVSAPSPASTRKVEPRVKEASSSVASKKASPKQKANMAPSPKPTIPIESGDHVNSHVGTGGRSILDFGKSKPGEELEAPTIILEIPLLVGDSNRYVNFMRMAEERYGWDALHPRQAAHRDRKARIAAASAALEKTASGSGHESGDELSVDLSDPENSNVDYNNGSNAAGAAAKPARKKRIFKEDEYDVGDDFVDDTELLWEAQAAASRDGFFVYSGPLVPEPEQPVSEVTGSAPKRARGRGARGGRGGARTAAVSSRGGSGAAAGSRGGGATSAPRKPRITKLEKAQRDREKSDRESLARTNSLTVLQPNLSPLPTGISGS